MRRGRPAARRTDRENHQRDARWRSRCGVLLRSAARDERRSGAGGRSRSGATWDGEGTNFSLFSEHAERVELCLFDEDGNEERIRVERPHRPQLALLPARRRPAASATATASTAPTRPSSGHRFNPAKLLIDPYAKAIDGRVDWDAANVAALRSRRGTEDADLEPDDEDSAPRDAALRRRSTSASTGRTTARRGAAGTRRSSTRPTCKGFTKRHPGRARGPARHLRRARSASRRSPTCSELGVTAVELLPIHHIVDESFLVERGLSNYWGYSSIGYLAPHARLRRHRRARRAGPRVQGDGQGAARAPASR